MCSRPSFGWGVWEGRAASMGLGRCQRLYDCLAQFEGESLNEEIPANEDAIPRAAESSEHPPPGRRQPRGSVIPD
jgi:hypothetical protein